MPVVRKFIRLCSPAALQAYFTWANLSLNEVDWTQNQTTIVEQIIRQVDKFSGEDESRIRTDAGRIVKMADQLGQAALLSVVTDDVKLSDFSSPIERSLWTYLHEPDSFQCAEDILYTDQQRHGRHWNHYGVPAGTPLILSVSAIEDFKEALKGLFGTGEKILVELFDRSLLDVDGSGLKAVQCMIYQESLPVSFLEFCEEALVPHADQCLNMPFFICRARVSWKC